MYYSCSWAGLSEAGVGNCNPCRVYNSKLDYLQLVNLRRIWLAGRRHRRCAALPLVQHATRSAAKRKAECIADECKCKCKCETIRPFANACNTRVQRNAFQARAHNQERAHTHTYTHTLAFQQPTKHMHTQTNTAITTCIHAYIHICMYVHVRGGIACQLGAACQWLPSICCLNSARFTRALILFAIKPNDNMHSPAPACPRHPPSLRLRLPHAICRFHLHKARGTKKKNTTTEQNKQQSSVAERMDGQMSMAAA